MNQRQIQKENTKKIILDCAQDIFSKNGLCNATTAEIALAANVSHGSIFAHFPTRDALLEAVVEGFGEQLCIRLHELAGSGCSMMELLKGHLTGIKENEDFYYRLISESNLCTQKIKNTIIMIQSTVASHMLIVAEKEIKEGLIMEMEFSLMFNTWMGLIHYYLTNRQIFAPGKSVIEAYEEILINHFLMMISTKKEN